MIKSLLFAAVCSAVLLPAAAQADVARASLSDAEGNAVGTVTLTDSPNGVLVTVDLSDLPVGEHGFHVHETGSCSPNFAAAGDHFNPDGSEHGLTNDRGMHAGDLPNLFVASDGIAKAHVFNPRISVEAGAASVLDDDGSAIIVHADPDSYMSEAGAGARIACGVVEAAD